MNGPPADVPPIWIALLVVSASVLGAVLALPSAPPPDATRVAETVDSVAATEHAATATAVLSADAIHVDRHGVGLRNEGGEAHAAFAFGPVTPVRAEGDLAAVLAGAPPESVFATPGAFREALDRARTAESTWQPADDRLRVRRVQYGGVEGVLVGQ
jgi:hypothetical protein